MKVDFWLKNFSRTQDTAKGISNDIQCFSTMLSNLKDSQETQDWQIKFSSLLLQAWFSKAQACEQSLGLLVLKIKPGGQMLCWILDLCNSPDLNEDTFNLQQFKRDTSRPTRTFVPIQENIPISGQLFRTSIILSMGVSHIVVNRTHACAAEFWVWLKCCTKWGCSTPIFRHGIDPGP